MELDAEVEARAVGGDRDHHLGSGVGARRGKRNHSMGLSIGLGTV